MLASLFVIILFIIVICIYLIIRSIRILLSWSQKTVAILLALVALAMLIGLVWFPEYYLNHTYMK